MRKLKLIIGTYNSSHTGCTGEQLEKKYQNSYKPFLRLLYGYPKVRASLYYSGILLEWFEENHPEILLIIGEMVKRRQVEIIGGGFYDPVLPMIPAKDRINQIELLTTYIRKKFGRRSRGYWLTERIWEPHVCSSIKNSGMNYTFLDETQFVRAGLGDGGLYKACTTEDQGKTLTILPVHSSLIRKACNSGPGEFLENCILTGSKNDDILLSLMFDGQNDISQAPRKGKVGSGWFEELFSLLSSVYGKSFQTLRAGDYVRTLTSLEKVYFPVSAGGDIEYYSLSPDRQLEWKVYNRKHKDKNGFFNFSPGFFRQFLVKYEKSNILYSKMLYTHNLVSQMKSDKSRKKSAGEEILKSQNNYPYWHGDRQGFYDAAARQKAFGYLINAEKFIREKGKFSTHLVAVDFDMDGGDEYIYNGQYINAYVHRRGGRLFELDYLVLPWNYVNTISRCRESYLHLDNIEKWIDKYPRDAFIDHFFKKEAAQDSLKVNKIHDMGGFANGFYEVAELDRDHKKIALTRTEVIGDTVIKVDKNYSFRKTQVEVSYKITNIGREEFTACFGVEINLSLHSHYPDNLLPGESTQEVNILDPENKVNILLNSRIPFKILSFPVHSFTKADSTFEELYQFDCFLSQWNLSLKPEESWDNTMVLKLEKK